MASAGMVSERLEVQPSSEVTAASPAAGIEVRPSSGVFLLHGCLPSAASASSIIVGSHVRVRPSVTRPMEGWGDVKAGSVGTVTEMTNGGVKCNIDFPEQKGWIGVVAEMEGVT